MLRLFSRGWLLFVVLLSAMGGFGRSDSYDVEAAPAEGFQAIPKTLAPALDDQGLRFFGVTRGKKNPVCDIWWKKQIAAAKHPADKDDDDKEEKRKVRKDDDDKDRDDKAKETKRGDKDDKDDKDDKVERATDLVYRGLKTGTLLGVVNYLTEVEDFQHHLIRPGLYTMRYAELHQDGEEDAISPYRDFLILTPAWAEKDADSLLPLDEMMKRSRLVTRQGESAILSLVPVNPAYKTYPWAVCDDRGFCTLQVRLRQLAGRKQGDLPLGLILLRPAFENEGS